MGIDFGGLFDGFSCDPDFRIFCCSCFFLPIRWADTASSPKIQFLGFWPGLLLMGVLISVVNITYGASLLAMLALAVLNRQRIRNLYGLPHKSSLAHWRSKKAKAEVLDVFHGFGHLVPC